MIISASRRTDIPTYYSDWFYDRIKAGHVCVRNPINIHQVSRVSLDPQVVDGIVFWTKNPLPMMKRLDELKEYTYYFQFTIAPYGPDIEKNIPDKSEIVIPAFQELSRKIGAERIIWRYDPILLTDRYSIEYHTKCFEYMAKRLSGYTRECVISFLDLYKGAKSNMKSVDLLPVSEAEIYELAGRLARIAARYGLLLSSCAEKIDLEPYGIRHGHCIDRTLFEELLGCKLDLNKDKGQRRECGCVSSIDIGMYNTCRSHCLYCYANHSQAAVARNALAHDPRSPFIAGGWMPEDTVTERKAASCKNCQTSMFDRQLR